MKVISTIQTLGAIRSVLVPHGLWEPPELRSVRSPRAPPSTVRWMVDALDGTVIDLEPETARALMPDSRRFDPHQDRYTRFRSTEIQNPESEIKRSVAAGTIQLEENLLLVLEDSESLPFESEPVFWTD